VGPTIDKFPDASLTPNAILNLHSKKVDAEPTEPPSDYITAKISILTKELCLIEELQLKDEVSIANVDKKSQAMEKRVTTITSHLDHIDTKLNTISLLIKKRISVRKF
jgi:hypothetical protein